MHDRVDLDAVANTEDVVRIAVDCREFLCHGIPWQQAAGKYEAVGRDQHFSWFDYRSKGFDREPKRGLRIDLMLASAGLQSRVSDAGIAYDIRAMEKPSDHCPVWVDFA